MTSEPTDRRHSILDFLFWAVVFGLAYTQAPLYYSNQHQYFLHGLAKAGHGQLADDWLANTVDPTPLFSLVVAVCSFREESFYILQILLLGVYFRAMRSIFEAISPVPVPQTARLAFGSLFILAHVALPRDQGTDAAWALARALLRLPHLWGGFARHALRMLWQARGQWAAGRLRWPGVRKISFFTHSFMDACALQAERIDACVFMAATVDGPMSMCAYNAERDRLLLQPIRLANGQTWQPLALAPQSDGSIRFPLKWLKGRSREAAIAQRHAAPGAPRPAALPVDP